jgi:hypothetical protein
MRRIRVYVDTSVFGGTQDERFGAESLRFFDRVRQGQYVVLLSSETVEEIVRAPEAVKAVWRALTPDQMEEVPLTAEVRELADNYIRAGILGESSQSDAVHVAAATVSAADHILSWNFRHIVNFNRIRGFNSINVSLGYRTMTILSPLEVAYEDERKDV